MTEDERRQAERQEPTSRSWAEAQQELYAREYTGPTTVHWNKGLPFEVLVPGPPERIRIHHRQPRPKW